MKLCNLEYLKSITPGCNSFAIQVIKLFIQETPFSLNGIKNGLSTSNWEAIYEHSHKLKPSFTIVGLPQEIIDTIFKINEFSKAETNTNEIADLVTFLDEEINKVYADLKICLIEMEG